MPFDWYQPARTKRPSHRVEVYRGEMEERAALLFRLRFSAAKARERLRAQLAWDFEVGGHTPPIGADEVDKIVEKIYQRGGPGAGAPTP
jgi:hypothetical protein